MISAVASPHDDHHRRLPLLGDVGGVLEDEVNILTRYKILFKIIYLLISSIYGANMIHSRYGPTG